MVLSAADVVDFQTVNIAEFHSCSGGCGGGAGGCVVLSWAVTRLNFVEVLGLTCRRIQDDLFRPRQTLIKPRTWGSCELVSETPRREQKPISPRTQV